MLDYCNGDAACPIVFGLSKSGRMTRCNGVIETLKKKQQAQLRKIDAAPKNLGRHTVHNAALTERGDVK